MRISRITYNLHLQLLGQIVSALTDGIDTGAIIYVEAHSEISNMK